MRPEASLTNTTTHLDCKQSNHAGYSQLLLSDCARSTCKIERTCTLKLLNLNLNVVPPESIDSGQKVMTASREPSPKKNQLGRASHSIYSHAFGNKREKPRKPLPTKAWRQGLSICPMHDCSSPNPDHASGYPSPS